MIVVVTHETSGFDKCSQELSKRLPDEIRRIHTRRYFEDLAESKFIDILHWTNGPVHLTNQNFGRYAKYLNAPYIITVHDLIRNFYNYDGEVPEEQEFLEEDLEGIRNAARIISVSEFTKKELIQRLGISDKKIVVIPNGVDHEIFKLHGAAHSPGYPYILYVGSERPRKNLRTLFRAFGEIHAGHPELRLIKVGSLGRHEEHAEQTQALLRQQKIEDWVIPTGYVSDEELAGLYRGAVCLVTPSWMEGFSLPPLEAMACGCPVVASDIWSHREVVGRAGFLVPPQSAPTFAALVSQLHQSRGLNNVFADRGLRRAKRFDWDKNAEKTLKVYEEVEREINDRVQS